MVVLSLPLCSQKVSYQCVMHVTQKNQPIYHMPRLQLLGSLGLAPASPWSLCSQCSLTISLPCIFYVPSWWTQLLFSKNFIFVSRSIVNLFPEKEGFMLSLFVVSWKGTLRALLSVILIFLLLCHNSESLCEIVDLIWASLSFIILSC